MRRNRGFTLMELMIVVGVIAILAAIAIPNYIEYNRKGKRAEGVAVIADIQMRQERWRAENPTYAADLATLLGSAANATAFNNSFKYYSLGISGASATGYTLTATRKGDLASDPKCGNLTMGFAAGVATKGVSSGVIDYCWRQ